MSDPLHAAEGLCIPNAKINGDLRRNAKADARIDMPEGTSSLALSGDISVCKDVGP